MDRSSMFRTFFAEVVAAKAGVRQSHPQIAAAFAKVERERFLGPGPWRLFTMSGYIDTPSDDPAFIYQDVPIGLVKDRAINNGEPTLHARCIAALDPKPGEHVLHVGAGSGYYTAVLAELVGAEGHVEAREIEADLAARAGENLRGYSQVDVVARSGIEPPLPPSDAIYVSAGASRPVGAWLDALKPGGRLVFPLTPGLGIGVMLKIVRGDDPAVLGASIVSPAAFIPCAGAQDEGERERLAEAVSSGDLRRLRTLRRDGVRDDSCVLTGDGWWLSA